jgi:4-hydroxybenzoate polyprenyltransferase
VLWTTAYDTMYAMVDRQDDIALGLKSTAILFDEADRLVIGGLQFCVLVCLCLIGYQVELGIYYYAGVVFAAFLAVYQQRLIYNRERDGCFKAFLNNNFFGMVVFVGMFIDYQLKSL